MTSQLLHPPWFRYQGGCSSKPSGVRFLSPARSVLVRIKMQALSWRLERQMEVAAMPALGLPASKVWACIGSGYFKDGHAKAKLPAFSVKKPA